MKAYVARRLVAAVVLWLVGSAIVFWLVAMAGDPLASLKSQPNVPKSTIELRSHQLGLDRPLWRRYLDWLDGVMHGNFGRTIDGSSVTHKLATAFASSLQLVVLGLILAALLGISVGAWSAVRQNRLADHVLTAASFVFLSLPAFFFAAVLQIGAVQLNQTLGRRVVFVVGSSTPGESGDYFQRLADAAGHLVLPTLALGLTSFAVIARFQRTAMIESLAGDHVVLARAKGLRRGVIIRRHGLRPSLLPIVPLVALNTGYAISGVVVIEAVFGWNGMGQMLVQGVTNQDTNVVLAWLAVASLIIIGSSLIADLLIARLDPRVRLTGHGR